LLPTCQQKSKKFLHPNTMLGTADLREPFSILIWMSPSSYLLLLLPVSISHFSVMVFRWSPFVIS